MKKMLSLLMALLMLVLCTAAAETATQTLTSPDGSYSIDVPADYFPMNSDTMMTLFTTDEMQQALAQTFGLEDASQLGAYFALLDANNLLFVYSGDMMHSLNVQANAATMTMEQTMQMKSMLDATVVQQYGTLAWRKKMSP